MSKIEEKRQAKVEEVLTFLRKIKSGEISQEQLAKMQEEWAIQKQINRYRYRAKGLITRAILGYDDDSETAELIGCIHTNYMVHLARQFVKGMNFENKCDWEVDHIVPMSLAKTTEEIKVLSKFTNLRPLWRKDNRKKHAKNIYLI